MCARARRYICVSHAIAIRACAIPLRKAAPRRGTQHADQHACPRFTPDLPFAGRRRRSQSAVVTLDAVVVLVVIVALIRSNLRIHLYFFESWRFPVHVSAPVQSNRALMGKPEGGRAEVHAPCFCVHEPITGGGDEPRLLRRSLAKASRCTCFGATIGLRLSLGGDDGPCRRVRACTRIRYGA